MAIKLESKMLSGRLPLLGKLPSARQLQILTGALVFFLLVDAAVVWLDARQSTFGTMYIATVGKIRMLSQRLAKAAQQASQGNLEAFKQLRESRDEFAAQMRLLLSGGEVGGVSLPATAGDARPVLDALDKEWQKNERNAALVIAEERNLIGLGQAVRLMNERNPALQELADEVSALSVQTGGSARQNAIAAQLMMLTQRMAKNANTMLAEAVIDPQVSFLLGKDVNNFRDTLQALLQGSEALRIQRVGDAELRGKLGELEARLQGVPARGRRHPRQPAAAGGGQARDLRSVPGQRKPAARRGAAEYRLRVAARGPAASTPSCSPRSRCSPCCACC